MALTILQACQSRGCWSSPVFRRNALLLLTFFVFGPLVCQHLLYSYFYSPSRHLDLMTQQFLYQNLQDGQAAVNDFTSLSSPIIRNVLPHLRGKASVQPWLVVTFITVRRKTEFHYLMQAAAKVYRLLMKCGDACSHYMMFICNVDQDPGRHEDVALLTRYFPTTEHYRTATLNASTNSFEKEKQDYAYCLQKTLSTFDPRYVLMLEDDTVPMEDIFQVINHLLLSRFPKTPLGGALYFKLYHPERLQHYLNPEPMRLMEWVGLGMFVGTFLSMAYAWFIGQSVPCWRTVLFFALYSMVLVEMVGRHYLLELRRLSPALYNVVPVTECCTQAMLYSATSARRVLGYLAEMQCGHGFAKDTALYSVLRRKGGEWASAVEPNLVRHVGLFSSLPRGGMKPSLL